MKSKPAILRYLYYDNSLKRNIRSTRLTEIEVEVKVYMEECARLRHQLEEVIKSKDTFADPQELKIIEDKFQQRDHLINSMQAEKGEILGNLQKKDEEIMKLAELFQETERRLKKAQASNKLNVKFKKDAKDKERDLAKLRKEVLDLKHQNVGLITSMKDMKNQ